MPAFHALSVAEPLHAVGAAAVRLGLKNHDRVPSRADLEAIGDAALAGAAAKGTRIVRICVTAVTAAQFALTYVAFLQAAFGSPAGGRRPGTG